MAMWESSAQSSSLSTIARHLTRFESAFIVASGSRGASQLIIYGTLCRYEFVTISWKRKSERDRHHTDQLEARQPQPQVISSQSSRRSVQEFHAAHSTRQTVDNNSSGPAASSSTRSSIQHLSRSSMSHYHSTVLLMATLALFCAVSAKQESTGKSNERQRGWNDSVQEEQEREGT